jgi:hypothetical protein
MNPQTPLAAKSATKPVLAVNIRIGGMIRVGVGAATGAGP